MLTELPTGTLTNMQYRRSRGTHRKFRDDRAVILRVWRRLYGEEIAAAKKDRRRGHSWRWQEEYNEPD